MTDMQTRLSRITTFLYALAAAMFAGTIAELLAIRHYEEPAQLIPFVLCIAGIAAIWLVWTRPAPSRVLALRGLMVVSAGGALLGVWKHLESNMASIAERNPGSEGLALLLAATGGRAPLLASGVLAAGACLAIAATFAAGWNLRGTAGLSALSVRQSSMQA